MSYNSTNTGFSIKSSFLCWAFLSIILATNVSCLDDEPDPVIVEHYIDNRLQPYFDTFKDEAKTRGVDVDFRLLKIDGYIQVIPEQGVAGQCQTNTNDTRTVVVQPLYWDNISELEKEFLIFHELGHCVLRRQHFDDANLDGSCVSMMNSGGLFCNVNYNQRTRDKYIDELFSR